MANSKEKKKENERWDVKCWKNQAKNENLKIVKRKDKKKFYYLKFLNNRLLSYYYEFTKGIQKVYILYCFENIYI